MSRRGVTLLVVVVGLALLDLAVLPLIDARVLDALLLAVVVVAVRVRPGLGALAGFVLGLLRDAVAPDAFGAAALALSLVGYGVSRLKAGFFEDRLLATAALVAAARLVGDVVYVLAEGRLGGGALALRLLWWAPVGAVVTAAVGLLVLRLVPPSDGRRGSHR